MEKSNIILLVYLFFMGVVMQYVTVLYDFFSDRYDTKNKFLLDLIPLFPVACLFLKLFKNLKKTFEEPWSKLK